MMIGGLILGSSDPSNPLNSRLVLSKDGNQSSNLQLFYFGIQEGGDDYVGFLVTHDLKYIIGPSDTDIDAKYNKIFHYFSANGSLSNGGEYPTWISDNMMFSLKKVGEKTYSFYTKSDTAYLMQSDALEDEVGTVITRDTVGLDNASFNERFRTGEEIF